MALPLAYNLLHVLIFTHYTETRRDTNETGSHSTCSPLTSRLEIFRWWTSLQFLKRQLLSLSLFFPIKIFSSFMHAGPAPCRPPNKTVVYTVDLLILALGWQFTEQVMKSWFAQISVRLQLPSFSWLDLRHLICPQNTRLLSENTVQSLAWCLRVLFCFHFGKVVETEVGRQLIDCRLLFIYLNI